MLVFLSLRKSDAINTNHMLQMGVVLLNMGIGKLMVLACANHIPVMSCSVYTSTIQYKRKESVDVLCGTHI